MKKCYSKVKIYGNYLKNIRIAVVVNDCPTSYKILDFIFELRKYSCDISVYKKTEQLTYITDKALEWASGHRLSSEFVDNKKYDAVIEYPSELEVGNIVVLNDDVYDTACKIVNNLSLSNLKKVKILVTAGPTPVKIDNVRRITNKFSGKLGIEIAKELYLRGADVTLLQSYSGIRPPKYIKTILFQDYDEYKKLCLIHCLDNEYGIFSAAVADYRPKVVFNGKIPSGGVLKNIELVATDKVINLVRELNPKLKMISFKYEEGKTLGELEAIADKRLHQGHLRVVTNDLYLNGKEQKCFLCGLIGDQTVIMNEASGKINIARMIADDLENIS